MIWVVGIVAFIIGCGLGVACTALIAGKKMTELNSRWYQTCLKITDGMSFKDARRKPEDD